MEQSFTPGPWETYNGGDHVAAVGGEHVASCETKADARLIAAAPELLEALRDATDRLEKALVIVGGDPEYAALGVARLRETIAKAAS